MGAYAHFSKELYVRSVLGMIGKILKFFTIDFDSNVFMNLRHVRWNHVSGAISDYLLTFPRFFRSAALISGTLPTEFGLLSALTYM